MFVFKKSSKPDPGEAVFPLPHSDSRGRVCSAWRSGTCPSIDEGKKEGRERQIEGKLRLRLVTVRF